MLAGGRFFYKQLDSFTKVSLSSSVRHNEVVPQHENAVVQHSEKVVIPPRIERGPTDILNALSATVGCDFTAMPYKYPDDPYFFTKAPHKQKFCALSLESGRKSAKWIIENNPKLFQHKLSDPLIKAFRPKVRSKKEKTNFSEKDLIFAIEQRNAPEAIKIYETLKAGNSDVSKDTQQCLLELVCFYNCNPIEEVDVEAKWYNVDSAKEQDSVWRKKGFAVKLFSEMDPNCPLANAAIILGKFKYKASDQALEHFFRATKAGMKFPVEVYNAVIENHVKPFFFLKFVNDMSEKGIKPNVGTMNAILSSLVGVKNFRDRKILIDQVFNEFRELKIKPTLGTYSHLFVLNGKTLRNNELGSLYVKTDVSELLSTIEEVEHEIQDENDFHFFLRSMNTFSEDFGDLDLLKRLVNMALRNNNSKFFVTEADTHFFYTRYCTFLFRHDSVDYALDQLIRFMGNKFSPNVGVFREAFSAIRRSQKPEHLARIYAATDPSILEHVVVLTFLLKLVNCFSDESSLKIFYNSAMLAMKKLEERILLFEEENTFSDILTTFVKCDVPALVMSILEIVQANGVTVLTKNSLELAQKYALSKKGVPLILKLLPLTCDADPRMAMKLAKKALPLLSGEDKNFAQRFIIASKKNKNYDVEEKNI